jgi:rRNA-processing protein FCF1
MRILLDTNALMMPAQCRIDLFSELGRLFGAYEPVVLESTLRELSGIAQSAGRDGAAARLGLTLAGRCTVIRGEPSAAMVDDEVIAYAKKTGCWVATNDRRLRDHLLDGKIGVISMRNGKKLDILRR